MKDKLAYSASSLSDGTLRFLALAVLASDRDASGLICMEEPENGIHPSRIPEMLSLVRSLADADTREPTDRADAASVRQVIINTHSPLVVVELPPDDLLMAHSLRLKGAEFVEFKPLWDTWRAKSASLKPNEIITRGDLLSYLQGSSTRLRPKMPPSVAEVMASVQVEMDYSKP